SPMLLWRPVPQVPIRWTRSCGKRESRSRRRRWTPSWPGWRNRQETPHDRRAGPGSDPAPRQTRRIPMSEFLLTVLTFPTLAYSVVLAVCTIYCALAATWLVETDALDGLLGCDGDAGYTSGAAAMLSRLGLSGVPVMVVITVLAFVGWLGTYFVHLLLLAHLGDTLRLIIGAAVAVGMLVPGIFATSALLRPLGRWLLKLRPP